MNQPTAVVTRGDAPPQALQKLLTAHQDQLVAALPKHMRPERLVRLAVTALHQTPSLQNCSMLSIANSVMLAAQLGLEPNNGLGHGWMIPYKGVCTFQPGYRGLIELAYRSRTVKDVSAHMVYAGDPFVYTEGNRPIIKHQPLPPSKRGEWIGAYSRLLLDDGTSSVHFMWREEIEAVRDKSSKAKDNGPWVTWFEEMVKKTVLKRHLKTRRLSPEVLMAVGVDDQAEAYMASEEAGKRKKEIVQDFALSTEFQVDAELATDMLAGSREKQQAVASEKLDTLMPSAAPSGTGPERVTPENFDVLLEQERAKKAGEELVTRENFDALLEQERLKKAGEELREGTENDEPPADLPVRSQFPDPEKATDGAWLNYKGRIYQFSADDSAWKPHRKPEAHPPASGPEKLSETGGFDGGGR